MSWFSDGDVPWHVTSLMAVLAAVVSFLVTPVAGRIAHRMRLEDHPSDRKAHVVVVPYLGGLAILAGWSIVFLTPGTLAQFFVLVAGMIVLGAVGLVDDARDLPPGPRLLIQFAVAGAACIGGIRMTPFDMAVPDLLLTLLWLVGITNAFNFMDNMDGLAATTGGIAAAGFGVLGVVFGQQLVSVLAFGLAGALAGFFFHNRHPASIFMGDAGSLPVGFALAAIGIKVEFPQVDRWIAFSVPLVVLGLFIIDTTVMAVGRLIRGEPLVGGRLDHVSHRLTRSLGSVRRVLIVLSGASVALATCGVVLPQVGVATARIVLVLLVLLSAVAVSSLLRLPTLIIRAPRRVPERVAPRGPR